MNKALNEVKIQAKKLLKACSKGESDSLARIAQWHKEMQASSQQIKLKHCQQVLARELGFIDWQQLQKLLSGNATKQSATLDCGTLFYTAACSAHVNQWFSNYQDAKASLDENHYLLPYKKQFVLFTADYLETLGISNIDLLSAVNRDMFASYPSEAWDKNALQAVSNRR